MIRLENVSKTFNTGVSALSDVNLSVEKGEFVFLVGPSGSGKTTFFRLLIRDMVPSNGSIVINDWEITKLPSSKVPHLRKKIGVVFQDLKLLMDRTIAENVMLPLEMAGTAAQEARQKVEQVLTQVGILEHKDKFPVQLSGGEMQRAAIARALVFSPDILLADEPTGNLDPATSWEIVKLLQDINNTGTTIVMATHNADIINSLLKRVIVLEKGKLVRDEKRSVKQAESAKEGKKEEKHDKKETKAADDGKEARSDKEAKHLEKREEKKKEEKEV